MGEAQRIARSFIRACGSPQGRRLDPERCNEIGGHTQIATITRTRGFRWVPGHKPYPQTWMEGLC